MKNFIKEYLKIIAVAITGFVFVLTSFYFVINYYHGEELKQQVYVGESDPKLVTYKNTLNQIKTNLVTFEKNKNTNQAYQKMYNSISTCHTVMTGQGLYYSMETNRYYGANDIYQLGSKFQSEILNVCWALQMGSVRDDSSTNPFKEVSPFITSEVNSISEKTSGAMEELLNNSSYFYTTRITSTTIRNYLTSDYSMIVDSYQDFADIILSLSKMINEGGQNG